MNSVNSDPVVATSTTPGAAFSEQVWGSRYATSLMNTFGAPQLVLAAGHGSHLVDIDGTEYLDLLGGIAVNLLGQAHPNVVGAVTDQIGRLGHVSNFFATIPQITLAEHLLTIIEPGGAPEGSKVFLANSGTEANECALKIVRAHANASDHPRPRILVLDHAFHGRTTGALALTWKERYRAPFEPLIPGVEFIPSGDLEALAAAMDDDVAGMFIEPIQGEAGVHEVPVDYLRAARDLTRAHGALLVFDEVQSGLGRTGEWMAHHPSGVVPDVVTLAKGLGGGLPIGACIGLGTAADVLTPGLHGTTFGGNPVCAAAANAVLETIESEDLISHARELGAQWIADLRSCGAAGLVEVRGRGLIIGLEFSAPVATAIVEAGRRAGFILNATSEKTVRLIPPLILTCEEAHSFTEALPMLVEQANAALGAPEDRR